MNLIPWRKTHGIPVARESALSTPIGEFRNEMDRLFDRYLRRGSWMEPTGWFEDIDGPKRDFIPSVDVAENDKQITICAEVPGMDPENVDISVSGNLLTIHGEKKECTEEKKDDFYHCERRFGSFTRSMELPVTADVDQIDAELVNGVLTLHVKKLATAQAKKIDVKPAKRELAGAGR
jgi:HSP20 family protein